MKLSALSAIALMCLAVTLTATPSYGQESVRPSAYTGRYYDARYEQTRRCIVYRESRGIYTVVNRDSGAGGAYQFMPITARTVAGWLGSPNMKYTRPQWWSRYQQDLAFWRLWDHGRGASHFRSRSHPC